MLYKVRMSSMRDKIAVTSEPTVDFEAEIETHTIRKSISDSAIGSYEDCIPLLIEDIPKIAFEIGQKRKKQIFGVRFQKIMIHGHSIPLKLKFERNERIYLVDDGTGSIIVHHKYTPEQMQTSRRISELSAQITHVKKHGFLQLGQNYRDPGGSDCKAIVACMDTVLRKIKQQSYLPNEFFNRGSKVSIIGNPYRHKNGEIHVWASEMKHDDDLSCSKEIFFKRYLIQMYESVYLKNTD